MKNSIIIGILLTLLTHDKVTVAQLSTKFEISRRSVFRYLQLLDLSGVPIVSDLGRYGGITISDSYKLNSTFFTAEEYTRLITSVGSFDLQDEITLSCKDKLLGLSKCLRGSFVLQSNQLLVDTPMTQAMQDKFALLERAIVTRKYLQISYHDRNGSKTNRKIEPYSLLLKDGIWYVYAFCLLRDEFRFFKISRINTLNLVEKEFAPREFDVNAAKNLGTPDVPNPTDIYFTLNAKVLPDVEEWLGVNCVKQLSYGQYYAEARLPIDNYTVTRFIGFGNNVKVARPEELKIKIKSMLLDTLQQYNN